MNRTSVSIAVVAVVIGGLVVFGQVSDYNLLTSGLSLNLVPAKIDTSIRSAGVTMPVIPQLVDCDMDKPISQKCPAGYICYDRAFDTPCPRGQDCSTRPFTQIGDNKCHKACETNDDCSVGQTCSLLVSYRGDISFGGKMCSLKREEG